MKTIRKILIANRGEIALRIMRTCREMGIRTVAIYSEADRTALHVRQADEAVPVGPSPSPESYLRMDRILEAARLTGADAVHPGYGFLAENAEFAEACERAGAIWIGPPAEAIRTMGRKSAGRDLAVRAGVPVVPAWQSWQDIAEFPVLIKAAAGGGGRGMRLVSRAPELAPAVESARREAEKAFGDGELLFERYIRGARHVEFQILGDTHGNLVHLFERDCSVQRRHQKLIEESPAPGMTPELRARMGDAAVALGRAMNYTSAGTVEFLLAPSGEFYFIEVNTRIQVEHPVTEAVTGLDLIRLQIEIAEGRELPDEAKAPVLRGHAIEARIYAEDPAKGFLPSAGVLEVWKPPMPVPGLRVETAVEEGSEIGIHYDPLIAKIIAHGADRAPALRLLQQALGTTCVLGVNTNLDFLLQVLESEPFRDGTADTEFLPEPEPPAIDPSIPAAVALYLHQFIPSRRGLLPGVPANWRNNPYRDASIKLRVGAVELDVNWRSTGKDRYLVNGSEIEVVSCEPGRIAAVTGGIRRTFHIREAGDRFLVYSSLGACVVERVPRYPAPKLASGRQTANSPMPGQVLRILVEPGQQVRSGDPLLILEAMKIEQTIRTAIDGVVDAVLVKTGEMVAPGQMLVEISAKEKVHASAVD